MLDHPQIFLLIDLNSLYACKPYEWLEFSRVGHCFVPQVVYEELDSWASSRSESLEARIAREFRRFMLESDWKLMRSLISTEIARPFSRRARLAIDVRNCAEDLARSSIGRLVVVVSNDRALVQQVQALHLENLTGIPVSTLLTWSRTKRQPPIVLQHLRSMQSHSLQLLGGGRSRSQISTIESPKSLPAPMYPKSWRDLLIPVLIILGGLALGWQMAQSMLTLNPQQTHDQQ
ncbi:MAG: hypothetical protein KME10_00075 [Plectolyngbya sp. WJT66-NPBG17]|jgi:rRNA-processing protein FCF1|nr:hypothetical protein [Plectolyngbya sp. WJT66-NPBG17]